MSTKAPPSRAAARHWLNVFRLWDQYLTPHHLLTRLMLRATRVRAAWFKNWQIRWFVKRYGVNLDETPETRPEAYPCFNAFFTRPLKPGLRPLPTDPNTVISPVDGTVSQLGTIHGERLFQAKGHRFDLATLLGGAAERAAPFREGLFATVYLAPRDYHRIHMPMDGVLQETVYLPGRLFSVSPRTVSAVPALFARNERLVAVFSTDCGPMAVILVGAMFVAGMETVWDPTPTLSGGKKVAKHFGNAEPQIKLARGEELGRFNMGSTVIVLLPARRYTLAAGLRANSSIKMGQSLARRLRPA
ncbi:MAG TPA: phosphatidylserine decarboxylase [Gammaproteobacteria bacterium]|nr:phosphatidylserine decarboxylase [Gammaproteobacteria bacterium]